MADFQDGSYSCTPGIALIGKVLAGRCKMRYTRAAVGKGTIPDGESPKTAREPPDYVMDARIVNVTSPVDGECQVSLQISNTDVEHGFFATGALLYAEDPDDGEVPYTYLMLENEPVWIRPSSSTVSQLATFDLIAAVGDVDNVSAVIDPESIVTRAVVEQLIADATIVMEITIPTKGWKVDTETGVYSVYLDVPIEGVIPSMKPMLTVQPDSLDTATSCGFGEIVQTIPDGLRVYSVGVPARPIAASLTLIGLSPYASAHTTLKDWTAGEQEALEMIKEIFDEGENNDGEQS